MENSSNLDENYDLGYQASPSSVDRNDQSVTGTPGGYSILSGDSFAYRRTSSSEASNFSELRDDYNYASESSLSSWPGLKVGANRAVLSSLGMKQIRQSLDDKLDDCEIIDAGWLNGLCSYM